MARVGLRSAMFNEIDTTTHKYKELEGNKVPKLERIIDEKFAPEYNSAELYADDVLAESDYSFKKGTLTITVADDDDGVEQQLMGYADGVNGVIAKETLSNSKEFGYGHIVAKLVNGVKKFKVEFFPRVRWTKFTTDAKTRGEGVEFGTTTIEGVVMPVEKKMSLSIMGKDDSYMAEGVWEMHKTFDSFEEAQTMLIAVLTPTVVAPTSEE